MNPVGMTLALAAASAWIITLPTQGQQFKEVHAAAGLDWTAGDFVHEMMFTAWVDLNQDGRLDLWVSPHAVGNKNHKFPIVYFNSGNGTFTKSDYQKLLPQGNGPYGDNHELMFADFDNDGSPDVYWNNGGAAGSGKPTGRHLWRWDKDHFQRVEDQYKLDSLTGSGRGALWFDWNKDGKLDLISVHAVVKAETGNNPSRLFEQTAAGFVDRTEAAGFKVNGNANFAVYSDLFGDGVPDIVMFGGEEKVKGPLQLGFIAKVFRHASPKLEDITRRFPAVSHGRDAAVADFNGDLVPDLFIVRAGQAFKKYASAAEITQADRDKYCFAPLYLQYDPASHEYVDRAAAAGFTEKLCGKTVLAGDFDNDGHLDLWIFQQFNNIALPAVFYRNNGNGTFTKLPNANGASYQIRQEVICPYDQGTGMSAAVGDYDNDGFLDIYTALMPKAGGGNDNADISIPPQLFHNVGNANHWLEIELIGTSSPRDPIGAKVLVTAGGRTQLREQNSGTHRTGQDMRRLHFGLGKNPTIDAVEIRWPAGTIQKLPDVKANQILRIVEKPNAP